MHALEITTFLDERISELTNDRLPEEPSYPSGQTQYASFMMPRDEAMNLNDKSPDKWAAYSRSNGSWADPRTTQDRPAKGTKNAYVVLISETLISRSEASQRHPPEANRKDSPTSAAHGSTLKSESSQTVAAIPWVPV
jgi:hypothetical protein